MPRLNRREFLGVLGTGATAWYFSRLEGVAAWAAPGGAFFDAAGPIERDLGDKAKSVFFGDQFDRAHGVLWNLPTYLKSLPAQPPEEKAELVIVGGGLSGLFSAYAFRDVKPVVLELADRFGGNAKGQAWRGVDFGLGSAYFPLPKAGTPLHRFFTELKLEKIIQRAPADEPVGVDAKIIRGFWDGAAEPLHAATYGKLNDYLKKIHDEKHTPLPQIPPLDARDLSTLQEWDKRSLAQALEDAVGTLPPLLARAIDAYCLSAFAAGPKEISAAAGLCFLASEVAPLCVAPGGNAGVAEHLLKATLAAGVPSRCLRPRSLVVQVWRDGDRVKVFYEDAKRKPHVISARAVVLACPKFVVAKILKGIEPEREAAIREIDYRSYLTAAALIDQPLRSRFYDMFLTGEPGGATDVVVGSLGQARGRNTVLTLYRAVPNKDARTTLSAPDAYAVAKRQFQKQIETELLPALGFTPKNVVDWRLARWGHALPVPAPGVFSRNVPALLRKPFGTNVFFVEQDNWLTPAMETGVGELVLQEPLIRAALAGSGVVKAPR